MWGGPIISVVPTPRDLIIIPGGRFISSPGKSFCLVPRPIGGDGLLARSVNFSATQKFFRRRGNFEKKVWSDAIDFVKKSSKSEPSLRFLSRSKFESHFSANSADRPGIYIETPYKSNFPRDVCLNSLKSGG